jgi:HSP20 family protein
MKVFGKKIGKPIKFPPFIDQFIGKLLPNRKNKEMVTIPATNISDEDISYELSIAIPGMDKKDIKLEIKGNYLIISANNQTQKKVNTKNWIRTEFISHSFYRAFELPKNVDKDKIEAKMNNGLLEIKIRKINKPENKKKIIVT